MNPEVFVDTLGPAEWIFGASNGGLVVHAYRLEPGDWLVSDVGGEHEGRGPTLRRALAELAKCVPPAAWWDHAAELLDGAGRRFAA